MRGGPPGRIDRALAMLRRGLVLLLLLLGLWLRTRTAEGWTFAGADSYAYLGAAAELREQHRYGFRPPLWYPDQPRVTPPGYGRLPGYPLFLSTLLPNPMTEYATVFRRVKLAQAVLDVLGALLIYLCARLIARRAGVSRWVGGAASFAALALCACNPRLILFSASILSETLATLLTTAVVVLVCAAMLEHHGRRATTWLILAGAASAAGALVRIDVGVTALLLPLPLLLRAPQVPRRALLFSLLAFTLVYSPWLVRNLLTFGAPHPVGRPCDIRGREMPHTAFFGWFATWVERESQTPDTLYCFMRAECTSRIATYPDSAFDSPAERAEVERLFLLRQRDGLTAEVDAGFQRLTRDRLLRHPLRTLVELPLRRSYNLWIGPHDQPLRAAGLPWPRVFSRVAPRLHRLSLITAALAGLGLLALTLGVFRRAWRAAVVLGLALLARTGFLALIGFVENRYTLEVLPAALLLGGLAVGQGWAWASALVALLRSGARPRPSRAA